MEKYYVYVHINPIKNEIFYVGKGCGNRCYSKSMRNKYWKNVVNKYGFKVEIIESNLSKDKACEIEIILIKKIGRKDLKEGTLVNMTDGGDGNNNFSDESKKLISDKAKLRPSPNKGKKMTKETKDKIAKTLRDKYLNGEFKPNMSGLNTKESILKLSKSKKGKPSSFKGRTMSLESRNKLSNSLKKYNSNPDNIEKIKNSNKKATESRRITFIKKKLNNQ